MSRSTRPKGVGMKQVVVLAATALIVIAGSQLVSSVGAQSNLTINRRVAILESKVKALQRTSTTLSRAVVVLAAKASCLSATGFTVYGNPAGTPASGYYYSSDGGAT